MNSFSKQILSNLNVIVFCQKNSFYLKMYDKNDTMNWRTKLLKVRSWRSETLFEPIQRETMQQKVFQIHTVKLKLQKEKLNWNTNSHGLYALIMSRTHFRVDLHSIVVWMLRKSLLETDAISEIQVTAAGLKRTTT